MKELLLTKVREFIDLIEKNLQLTGLIEQAIANKEWEKVGSLVENRERSVDVISNSQEKIEELVAKFGRNLDQESIQVIRVWAESTQNWIDRTALHDQNILVGLESEKEQTVQEIAQIFKSKRAFKGYSLNDVSK